MDHNETIQDIKERLVKIEVLLENMVSANDLKMNALEEKIKVANHRITNLEETNKWLWRTVGGAFIAGGISILMTLMKAGAI